MRPGSKMSEEAKARISAKLTGRKFSDESRRRMSESGRARAARMRRALELLDAEEARDGRGAGDV